MKIKIDSFRNIGEYPIYFFDANVWIIYLHTSMDSIMPNYNRMIYVNFLDKIINEGVENKEAPKIAITSLLLSELLNKFVIKMGMMLYFGKDHKEQFKHDYRPTEDYKNRLKKFIMILSRYQKAFQYIDDKPIMSNFIVFLEDFENDASDFNDYHYYKLMKKHNIPIVTDDADFQYNDITIFSQNPKLLKG